MILIPAIDLKDGKVVRLFQGNFKEEKVYAEKPQEAARRFEAEGAKRIHVVDLDGALKGEPKNRGAVEAILKNAKAAVQVGGGIRSLKTADQYLAMGVSWVVLGTAACLDRGFLQEAVREFGSKVIVGADAREGWIATDGWTKVTKTRAVEFVKNAQALGVRTVIYTDISKDGALKGPNIKEIEGLSQSVELNVIASGGIGTLKDIEAIVNLKRDNIAGIIVGKALYENRFSLKEASALCSQNG